VWTTVDNYHMLSEQDVASERTTVGSRVREARLQAGLTPRALARRSGLTKRTLMAIESGRGALSDEARTMIATACAVDVGDLSPREHRQIPAVPDDPATASGDRRGDVGLDALLREYLAMVVEMRNTTSIPLSSLRAEDLDELARALGGTPQAIEARIAELLGSTPGEAAETRNAILPSTAHTTQPAEPAEPAGPSEPAGPGEPGEPEVEPSPAEPTTTVWSGRDEQRRAVRKPVTWSGRFGTEGQPEWAWRGCTIRDISDGGAQLTVQPDEVLREGDVVVFVVERMGSTPVSVNLQGRVRRCTPRHGALDVGVELAYSTLQQRHFAESLFERL
jgi:transcriptional regulator with XRE-family HTH domain